MTRRKVVLKIALSHYLYQFFKNISKMPDSNTSLGFEKSPNLKNCNKKGIEEICQRNIIVEVASLNNQGEIESDCSTNQSNSQFDPNQKLPLKYRKGFIPPQIPEEIYQHLLDQYCDQYYELVSNESNEEKNIQPEVAKIILERMLIKIKKSQANKKIIFLFISKLQSKLKKILKQRTPLEKELDKQNLNKYQHLAAGEQADLRQTIPEDDIIQLRKFKDVVIEFERSDYSFLYKKQDMLAEKVTKILENWELLGVAYKPQYRRFLDLISVKIEPMTNSRIVYATLFRIKDRISSVIGNKKDKKNMNIEDQPTDLLFYHYLDGVINKASRPKQYTIKDPETGESYRLQDYMAKQKEYFQPYSSWGEIIFVMTKYILQIDSRLSLKNQQFMSEYIQSIPFSSICMQECLGCQQFFFAKQNIYYPERSKHILVLLGSIEHIEVKPEVIKDEICALLNGKGGVLLFDTDKIYNCVIPKGRILLEKEKLQIQKGLTRILHDIHPQPIVGKNIFFSWVPMAENLFDSEKNPIKQIKFIEGAYVFRIIIKPTHGHMAYFWNKNSQSIFSIRTESLFPDGKRHIRGKGIPRFLKKKMSDFEGEFLNLNQMEKKLLIDQVCTIDHECKKPKIGLIMLEMDDDEPAFIQNPQNRYRYAAVAVAQKKDHKTIRKNLQKKGIDCYINAPFERLNLKGVNKSSIIYHNIEFDELTQEVKRNKNLEFGGRPLILLPITDYLILTDRSKRNIMSREDFDSLSVWLRKQYPQESMKMWSFLTDKGDYQYYMQTTSKESSFYIFIVMSQFNERSSFKNPMGLERLGDSQLASRFKVIYQT